MRNNLLGSTWGKWDFHFHTPSSFDYKDKSVTNEEIITVLIDNKIKAVAITDHHTMDVERIIELQKLAGDAVTIFPGIELRSELGGSETVHYIGIFPESCEDLANLWTKLAGSLNLTPGDIKEKGDENIYVPFTTGAKLIHSLGGIVSVHAGKKSNSIENIKNTTSVKMTVKTDLVKDYIDIYEVGKVTDVEAYKKNVFPNINVELPLVICSDNHNIKECKLKENCWIKADCTFPGLKQVINEPGDRVFVGELPSSIKRVDENRTKYIDRILIQKVKGVKGKEKWFDTETVINHGLVAIIGNKGSGKSALADIIGLIGNTRNEKHFSFLNEKKFQNKKNNKSKEYEANLTWRSGGVSETRGLDKPVPGGEVEYVNYIPQNYLEEICNEVKDFNNSQFNNELKEVIFSHVDESNRLEQTSLDELIEFRTVEKKETIELLKKNLIEVNEKITGLENRISEENIKLITNSLEEKEREFSSLKEPDQVKKPKDDKDIKEEIGGITKDIQSAKEKLASIKVQIVDANKRKTEFFAQKSSAEKLLTSISNLNINFTAFRIENEDNLRILGIKFDDIASLTTQEDPVKSVRNAAIKGISEVDELLNIESQNSLTSKQKNLEEKIIGLEANLDKPNKLYQGYLQAKSSFENKKKEIIGTKDTKDTIEYFKDQIKSSKKIPKEISELEKEQKKKAREIYKELNGIASVYEELYEPVQTSIESHEIVKDKINLEFNVSIMNKDFEANFLNLINHGRRGTFCGVEEGGKTLKSIVGGVDFNTEEATVEFIDEILKSLRTDSRNSKNEELKIINQLKDGVNVKDLYDLLFSLDYLMPRYTLTWDGKELEQLSPGERGTLLLIFYLIIDNNDIPIIIDQPEENLDNETIYKTLVPCIKDAKERRQIIIVTHNPNLAVVCDAEQIIVARLDKTSPTIIDYVSGAIENPTINEKIIDILEGTRPAFDNRDSKYKLT